MRSIRYMQVFEYFWTGLLAIVVVAGLVLLMFGLPILTGRRFGDSLGWFWDDTDEDGG